MSARTNNTAVIIGSGPGIGSHTGALFASKRFNKVALVARNPTQLAKDATAVAQAASSQVQVKTYSTDISDHAKFAATLKQISNDLGTPEFVLFNASLVRPSALLQFSEEEIILDFKISTTGLYVAAKWAIPLLSSLAEKDSAAKPTLMVTNSHLPEDPAADLFALSLTKASQKNLTRSLRAEFEPQGIHICLLTVAGAVTDDKPYLNNKNIANKAWDLYNQEKGSWTEDIRIEEA